MIPGPPAVLTNEAPTRTAANMTKENRHMRKVLLQMGLSVDGIVAGGPQDTSEADNAPDEDEGVRRWKLGTPPGRHPHHGARTVASQARRLESIHGWHGHMGVRASQESATRRDMRVRPTGCVVSV